MNMKKTWIILLCVTMLFALVLTGCGEAAPDNANNQPKSWNVPDRPVVGLPTTTTPPAITNPIVGLLSWGGTIEESLIDYKQADAFKAATGYTCELTSKSDSATIIATALAQVANPVIDLVWCDKGAFMAGVNQDIFQPLSNFDLPSLEHVFESAIFPTYCHQEITIGGMIFAYEEFDKNGWPYPNAYFDLANPNYAGRVTLDQYPSNYTDFVIFGFADDDPANKIDQAFAKLRQIAPNLFEISETKSQVLEWMKAGNTWISAYVATMYYEAVSVYEFEVGYALPSEGIYSVPQCIGIMKNCPNQEGAGVLFNWLFGIDFMQNRCDTHGKSPCNKLIQREGLDIVGSVSDQIKNLDFNLIFDQRDAWLELWNENVLSVPRNY